jgi:hypothetical protein
MNLVTSTKALTDETVFSVLALGEADFLGAGAGAFVTVGKDLRVGGIIGVLRVGLIGGGIGVCLCATF